MPPTTSSQNIKPIWMIVGIGVTLVLMVCFGCLFTTVLPTAGFFASAFFHPTSTPNPVVSSVANQVMAVSQMQNEKIVLNGPEVVNLDAQGNIYVGNDADGTISIFDPSGNLMRSVQWVDKNVNDTYLNGMAVASDGTIYVSYQGDIHRLNPDGSQTTLPYDRNANLSSYLEGIVMQKDGSLLASDISGNIVRFDMDGNVHVITRKPFDAYLHDSDDELIMASDDAGNIYVLGKSLWQIIKLAPDGSFISQFGGHNHHHVRDDPGEPLGLDFPSLDPGFFFFPTALAIAPDGRIFVGDTGWVQVFDEEGTYIDYFDVPDNISSLTFDHSGDLYITTDTPQLLKINVQAP